MTAATSHDGNRRIAVLVGCAAVIAGVVAYLWLRHHTLARLLLALGIGKVPLHDYQAFFYPMGAKVLSSPQPIEGFLYSPFAALFFAPFSWLPYHASAWAWAATLLLLTFLLAWESVRPVRRHAWLVVLIVGIIASAMPVLHNHKFGQVSLLIVVPILLCVHFYERGRPVLAAACLMFSVAFKFYPAFFLIYFAFRRDWRFLAAAAGFGLLFLVVIPAIAIGPLDTLAFYQDVARQIESRFGSQIADKNSQSFLSFFQRLLLDKARLDPSTWRPVLTVLRYALCAGLLVVTYRLARSRRPDATRWAFLWLLAASPFFVVTSWPHYFAYLPAIVAATLGWVIEARGAPLVRALVAAASLGAAALSSIFVFDLVGNRHVYSWWGYLFFADLLALLALALALLARRREPVDVAQGA
ncbi:MAG TPA: glycosyltransferase family 87 protein [Kofleriaceae bacterium]|nr:glycosyltransferase family 87 protein [Kofleriaceae bacterium]